MIIHLKSPSKREYYLIHGYTGSSTDFNELPDYLHKTYNVNVKVPLLKGHGTSINDLDNLKYSDFLNQVEQELKRDIAEGKEIIIGGISFGAQLALLLAARYPVHGLFCVSTPYKIKFPFNIPKLELIGWCKKYWQKVIPNNERQFRKESFYYSQMHINGLKIVKQANRDITQLLGEITCPILIIHSKKDSISHFKTVELIEQKVSSTVKKRLLFNYKNHSIFFTEKKNAIQEAIRDFFEFPPRRLEAERDIARREKVAAIVPAYNEGERIAAVLKTLTETSLVDEVVVVDDGSVDNTADVVREFPKVRLLQNEKNIGKSFSIQKGVKKTDASILFFCDADLVGLTPSIVEQIIKPVIKGECDMFLGIRNNVMQKAINLFAVNSGERALRRELWNKLPDYFKYRYRIEVGLNYVSQKFGKGYSWKIFNYYQTIKEKKYGIVKGMILRWWMYLDVGVAYSLVIFNKFKIRGNK
jgi:esterase/lipase